MRTSRANRSACAVVIFTWLCSLISILLSSCSSSNDSKSRISEIRQVLPKQPELGSIFTEYRADRNVSWKKSWVHFFDLTGVAWNDARCSTLIDAQHVVMAAHYARPADVALIFHDHQGNRVERYIIASKSLAPEYDVVVARLNMAVPEGVSHYPMAQSVKIGQSVLVTDQTLTAFVHCVYRISAQGVQFAHCSDLSPLYAKNLVPGASGHPSFLWQNGRLELVETHTFGGPGAGPNYASSDLQHRIAQCVRTLAPTN